MLIFSIRGAQWGAMSKERETLMPIRDRLTVSGRWRLFVFVLLALTLVTAACGDDDSEDTGADTAAETDDADIEAGDDGADEEEEEAAEGDGEAEADDGASTEEAGGSTTIRIGMATEAQSLDPPNFVINADTVRMDFIFDRLVNTAEDGSIVPGLATEWTQVDDVTWEFTLREGVTFHDGTPFDASAVEFVLERSKEQDQGGAYLSALEDVEVVDDYLVRLNMNRPFAAILNNLSVPVSGMYSPAAVEEYGDRLGQNPVGTGPYRFVSWDVDEQLVLAKNEDYWGDAPALDEVIFIPIPEASTRLSALRTGEIDVIENPPPDDLASFESFGVEAIIQPKARPIFLGFNVEAVPDVEVRRAIAMAIDREIIVEAILEGIGAPADSSLVTPAFRPGEPPLTIEYDPEAAAAMLEEAGYGDGIDLRVVLPVERYLRDTAVLEVIQAQLAEIGVRLELDIRETGAWYQALLDRDTELYWLGWGLTTYDPGDLFARVFASGQVNNMSQLESAAVDELVGQLESTPVGTDERRALITELERLIVETEVAVTPIYHAANFFAVRDGVEGFRTTVGELIDLSETTVD